MGRQTTRKTSARLLGLLFLVGSAALGIHFFALDRLERARAARAEWRLADASRLFDQALGWGGLLGTTKASARLDAAETAVRRGMPGEVRRLLAPHAAAGLDLENDARAQLYLGTADFYDRRPEEALDRLRRAGSLTTDESLVARAALEEANVLFISLEDADAALDALEAIRELHLPADDSTVPLAAALEAQARWWSNASSTDPGPDFEQALAQLRRLGNRSGEAEVLSMLAFLSSIRGDWGEFFRLGHESLDIFEDIDNPLGAAGSHMIFGWTYHRLGRISSAIDHYGHSLEAARRAGSAFEYDRVSWLLARAWIHLGRLDRAEDVVRHQLPRTTEDSWRRRLTTTLGEIELRRGRPEAALRHFEAVRAIRGGDETRLRQQELTVRAQAEIRVGELERAAATLDEARRLSRGNDHARDHATLAHTLAELAAARGDAQRRADLLLQGYFLERVDTSVLDLGEPSADLLEALIGAGRHDDLLRVLDAEGFHVGRALAMASTVGGSTSPQIQAARDAVFEATDPTDEIDELRRRYADFESQTLAALDPSFLDALRQATPRQPEEIRAALGPSTRLLRYFFVGSARDPAEDALAYVLVLQRGATEVVPLGVRRGELAAKVKLLLHLIRHGSDVELDVGAVAERLYDSLLAPLAQRGLLDGAQDGIQSLALIPAGPLVDLPFAALQKEGRYLVDDYYLYRLPSASFLARERSARGGSNVVIGIGRAPVSSGGLNPARLPRLPHAIREARQVAETLGTLPLLDASWPWRDDAQHAEPTHDFAHEELVRTRLETARLVHYAGHGVATAEMPLLAHLPLAEPDADSPSRTSSGDLDDGRLTVREILSLGLRADLVTLSACHGALRPTAETGDIGLADAFLLAGADSVLASLTPVEDRCAEAFMLAFYEELTHGADRAAALARTQQLLAQGRGHGSDIACWSPWVLLGHASTNEEAPADPPFRPLVGRGQLESVDGHE